MSLIVNAFGALVAGVLVVVLSVSFTSIVFTGPLESMLDRGIGATLLGAFVASVVGGAVYSYRATISNPQDLTAILLAGAAAQIAVSMGTADSEALFATVLMLLVTASAVAGLAVYLAGRFRLSDVVRYIPYPVMGGFLAATGYLLLVGAIGMLLGRSVDLWTLGSIFAPADLALWLPWVIIGAAILSVSRLWPFDFLLPVALALILAGFYAYLAITGQSLDSAAEQGLLLGPFGSGGFLNGLGPGLAFQADWALVAGQGLTLIAVAAMVFIGAGLNLSGIELIVDRELDPNRDFRAIGLAALAAAPTGGLIGFPGFAATILGFRVGITSYAAVVGIGGICLVTAVFGAGLLELLPRGLFGATIAFIGLDLLVSWLWSERRKLMARDTFVVLTILVASAALGFLVALALGLAVSILIFVISYSTQDFVRLRTTLAVRSSGVERPVTDVIYLSEAGGSVAVFEFRGYLFFGTATRLRKLLDETLNDPSLNLTAIILDFSHVTGLDPSVSQTLQRIEAAAAHKGLRVSITGLSSGLAEMVWRFNGTSSAVGNVPLENVLRDEEERLLVGRPDDGPWTFLDVLGESLGDLDPLEFFPMVEFIEGAALIRAGDRSDEMFILVDGAASVTVNDARGTEREIAEIGPGALIGEIGYFSQHRRTADVMITQDARLLRIDANALAELGRRSPELEAKFMKLAAGYLAQRMDRSTRLISALLA